MTTYTILTGAKTVDGSIRSWVNDSTVPATNVLTMAEDWIYTRLRVGHMLQRQSGSISSGATSSTVPSDYLATEVYRVTTPDARELESVEPERLEELIVYDTSGNREPGPPCRFARIGTSFEFDYQADKAYTTSHLYYAYPDRLSGSNETNFLTDRYSPVLYWACQGFAYDFKKDVEKSERAFARAEVEIARCNADWDRERQESEGGIYALDV